MKTIQDLTNSYAFSPGIAEDGSFENDVDWTLTQAAQFFGCSYDTILRDIHLLESLKADGFRDEREPESRLRKEHLEALKGVRNLRVAGYRGRQLIKKLVG